MKPLAEKEVKFKVEYSGGHSSYPNDVGALGTIFVSADYVKFKSIPWAPKVEFGFPIEKLKSVKIRTTRRVNWGKAWTLGWLTPLLGKEKYVQVAYEDEDGTLQIVDFDFPDDSLNIRKNKFVQTLQGIKEKHQKQK